MRELTPMGRKEKQRRLVAYFKRTGQLYSPWFGNSETECDITPGESIVLSDNEGIA
jgi:hypothetical protein